MISWDLSRNEQDIVMAGVYDNFMDTLGGR